jgi:hypothetical protein
MATTTTEQTTTNIPDWAKPYAGQLFGMVFGDPNRPGTGGILNQPWQQYTGQRVAGVNPLAGMGYQDISRLGVSPEVDEARYMAGLGGMRAGSAGADYMRMATDPRSVSAFMSPYMQNVVDQQKQRAIQDYSRQIPGLQTAGIRAGARGGTREALLQAEAQRNLQSQLGDIQATGSQNAFQQAQQAQQFGSNLGMQGIQQQLAASGLLGNLGNQRYNQLLGGAQARIGAGSQLRDIEQQQLSNLYQDFINKQQYPYKQLEFASGILRGFQPTGSVSTLYQPSGSSVGSTIGAGLGLGGMFGAMSEG